MRPSLSNPQNRQRGGSIFTMLIFIMLLFSSGLMYYYFHRTQVLERELSAWKSGNRTADTIALDEEPAGPVSTPKPRAARESIRDLAAKLAGTPATRPLTTEQEMDTGEEEPVEDGDDQSEPYKDETPSSPAPTPRTGAASTARVSTPRSSTQSPPLLRAPALNLGEPEVRSPGTLQTALEELPEPDATSRTTAPSSDSRPAAVATATPMSSPRPTPQARQTPIGSLYDVPAGAEPTVRVRAPSRTPRSR